MGMTDPIADMLTRIRNAGTRRFEQVDIPASRLKTSIAQVLKDEGYIRDFKLVEEGKWGMIRLFLKHDAHGKSIIGGLKRVSKPGRRVYVPADSIPPVLGGLGVSILSTSRGLMTDRQARRGNIGGELVCSVW
ncbi:MAG: 30S ribosomal protein S8 [Pseudomonadota bacterium]